MAKPDDANHPEKRTAVRTILLKLLRDYLVILGCSTAVVLVLSLLACLKGSDAPLLFVFIIFGFCYACGLPGLLIPYAVLVARKGPGPFRGTAAPVFAGFAYPAVLAALALLGEALVGREVAALDRLVESVLGWLVLIVGTLGSGTALSYTAIAVNRAVNPVPTDAPDARPKR